MDTDLRTLATQLLPVAAGVAVVDIHLAADALQFTVIATQPQAACPLCGALSNRIHSRYRRALVDLPWATQRVEYHMQVRRFRCPVPTCPRRIFTERLPALVAPYARRTTRLAGLLRVLGLVVGGRPTVRLVRRLGMPVSLASLLRLVRRSASTGRLASPTCVGIDDFALRRGQRYGTVLVDLERHRPIELLAERSAASAATWFAGQPAVRVISRDRAGVYAEGARQGAPQASQVAERWHLLHNLTEALQRVVARHHAALRRAVVDAAPHQASPAPASTPVSASTQPANQRTRRRQASTARRQAHFEEIARLHATGASISVIAAHRQMGRQTVRRYLRAGGPPADQRGRRPTQVAPFDAYLRERWATGEQNISALWREIRARGFTGGLTSVHDYVAPWRTTPGRRGPAARRPVSMASSPPPDRRIPSARQVTWWLLAKPQDLDADQRAIVAHLLQAAPALQQATLLAQTFGSLLRERRAADLIAWLDAATTRAVPEFVGAAKSLRQDLPAVTAALRSPHSNGQTEGQVTRIKLLKRQLYGRANFDLLRLRVLYRDVEDTAA